MKGLCLLLIAPVLAKKQAETDDSAMLFFLLAMLTCGLVPWSFSVLWYFIFPGAAEVAECFPAAARQCRTQAMQERREKEIRRLKSRKISIFFAARLVLLLLLWCWLLYIIMQVRQVLATSALYQNFDPYGILDVSSAASSSQIKKAFHKLSLKYHPDKNPEKAAAEQFILIKKAYDALTDPVAKRNYRLYGNPDGPVRVELSVALPSVEKEKQGLVLVLFLLLFVIGVPLLLLYSMQSTTDANGLPRASNEVLRGLGEAMDVRGVQELLLEALSVAETSNPGVKDYTEVRKQLSTASFARKRPEKEADLRLQRAEVVYWCHILRRRELLNEDPEPLLRQCEMICKVLIQLAAKKGLSQTLQSGLEVYRGLVQAMDPSGKGPGVLLQIPHFESEQVRLWQKRQKRYNTLPSFLSMPSEELRRAVEELGLSGGRLADVEEFWSFAPRLEVQEAKVYVAGEEEIRTGDVATLELRLLRGHLREGEEVGSGHAPHFGGQVREAWWVTFRLPGRGKSGVSVCSRISDPGREVVAQVRFRVPLAGKCRLRLQLSCECYAGLELEEVVDYVAKHATVHDASESGDSGSEDMAD